MILDRDKLMRTPRPVLVEDYESVLDMRNLIESKKLSSEDAWNKYFIDWSEAILLELQSVIEEKDLRWKKEKR